MSRKEKVLHDEEEGLHEQQALNEGDEGGEGKKAGEGEGDRTNDKEGDVPNEEEDAPCEEEGVPLAAGRQRRRQQTHKSHEPGRWCRRPSWTRRRMPQGTRRGIALAIP